MAAKPPIQRPKADAESVEYLIGKVLRGEIRTPHFQRLLKWKAPQVLELFDSIYRGYPVGSLLFQKSSVEASPIEVGPLRISGQTMHGAWLVIDGQQRLGSLAASLARTGVLPTRATDPWVVYFDPESETFRPPPLKGELPSTWVPLPKLLDASELSEWIHGWPHSSRADLRSLVFEAGKRLREYRVPFYLIETDDETVPRIIYERVNNSGIKLLWTEVHEALYQKSGEAPSTLNELATSLEDLGMGRPDEQDILLPSLLAIRGLDVTRSAGEHFRSNRSVLDGAAPESAPILREVLGFVRARAAIPHIRMLPYSTTVLVLARFFKMHPSPSERTRTLLVRWIWRTLREPSPDDRAIRRGGVRAIDQDEDRSVQGLLALAPRGAPGQFEMPASFDARSARSRIVLLAMNDLAPLDLQGVSVDVAGTIRERDADAFRPIFSSGADATSPANRILLPGSGSARQDLVTFIRDKGEDNEVLRSHGIGSACAGFIATGNIEAAIADRAFVLAQRVDALSARLAEWGRTDRPSIDYLVRLASTGES